MCASSQLHAQLKTSYDKINDIQAKIDANNKKILPKKVMKKREERTLGVISRELKYIELELQQTKGQLARAKKNELQTKEQLQVLEKKYKAKEASFEERLVEIYQMKNLGFLEFLFSGKDIVNYVDSTYYFDRIIKKDINLIEDIQDEYEILQQKRTRLRNQTKKIDKLKKDIAKKENVLKSKKYKQNKVVRSLATQIASIERQNKELEIASNSLTSLIRKKGQGKSVYHATGSFIRPVKHWMSSKYGYRIHPISKRRRKHNGVDFAAPRGTRIRASNSGYVIVAGQKQRYKGYGKIVVIDHGKRPDNKLVSTFYAHQSRILVKEGDFVTKGQEIGWVGSTGYSTGPHLHFELRVNGVPVNPMSYIK